MVPLFQFNGYLNVPFLVSIQDRVLWAVKNTNSFKLVQRERWRGEEDFHYEITIDLMASQKPEIKCCWPRRRNGETSGKESHSVSLWSQAPCLSLSPNLFPSPITTQFKFLKKRLTTRSTNQHHWGEGPLFLHNHVTCPFSVCELGLWRKSMCLGRNPTAHLLVWS